MPRITGVSHIELTVRDAAVSAAWYEDVLGMRRFAEHDEHPTPGVEGRVVNMLHPSGVVLSVVSHPAGDGSPFSEFHIGLDHLAFTVETREELDAWAKHLDTHGVQRSAISEMSYGSVLVFRDPDNIQLELLAWSGSFS